QRQCILWVAGWGSGPVPQLNRNAPAPTMIDTLVLALTHGLLLVVAWRLVNSPAVDDDSADGKPPAPRRGWKRPGA
ncbi:hypothetical protein, partial [Sphingomonas sp.]|uniref:hypothetical protein n=1 Tax=Sphingomonas sp. TaxID=28214 RepID=UPI00307E722C